MPIKLVTRDGEPVAELEIPARPALPEVLLWGDRAFVHAGGLIGGGPAIYREGDLVVVPA